MEKESVELRIMAAGAEAALAQVVAQRRATENLDRQQHNFRKGESHVEQRLQAAIFAQEGYIAKQEQLQATIAEQQLSIAKHEATAIWYENEIRGHRQVYDRQAQRIDALELRVKDLETENAYAVERKEVYKRHWMSKGQELRRLRARLDYERERYYNRRNHGIRQAERNNEMRNNEEDAPGANVVHL